MPSPSKRGSSHSPSCAESLASSPKSMALESRSRPNTRTRPSSYSRRRSAASRPGSWMDATTANVSSATMRGLASFIPKTFNSRSGNPTPGRGRAPVRRARASSWSSTAAGAAAPASSAVEAVFRGLAGGCATSRTRAVASDRHVEGLLQRDRLWPRLPFDGLAWSRLSRGGRDAPAGAAVGARTVR